MNDLEIRQNFHRKKLGKYYKEINTLIIDELALNNGKNRADIAVINNNLIGYEIKGNNDSLFRLKRQVQAYNSIFNKCYVITGTRHEKVIFNYIPEWWGIIISEKNIRDDVNFFLIRKAYTNKTIRSISLIRLLWRPEVIEILRQNQVSSKILRKPKAILYESLAEMYNPKELQKITIGYIKKRKNWRCQ
jgi:hypothetical protein